MIDTDEPLSRPLPRSVYLRRRVVAVVGSAAGVVALAWVISGLLGGGDAAEVGVAGNWAPPVHPSSTAPSTTSPAPTASTPASTPAPPPQPPPPPPPDPRVLCPDPVIAVAAEVDPATFRVGTRPALRVVVTNTGPVPCTRDIGRAHRELVISAGPNRLWSSNDCTPADGDEPTVLNPGQRESFEVKWAGRTSGPGCPTQRDTVPPGTYQVTAHVGGLVSPPVPITVQP